MFLIALFGATKINTAEPNEPADLIAIPVFFAFFMLNWRAMDLLVSLERQAGQNRNVTVGFIAVFYLPLTIGGFYDRLIALKRKVLI